MKTLFLISFFTAAAVISNEQKATVQKIDGLHIFILSEPDNEYITLGSVKKSVTLSGKPEELIQAVINKAKKEYPAAEGVIFQGTELDKAEVIKWK